MRRWGRKPRPCSISEWESSLVSRVRLFNLHTDSFAPSFFGWVEIIKGVAGSLGCSDHALVESVISRNACLAKNGVRTLNLEEHP